MEKHPRRTPSEDFKTDLSKDGESGIKPLDLGAIDMLDDTHINPDGIDDVVGKGGLVELCVGLAKSVLRRIINS